MLKSLLIIFGVNVSSDDEGDGDGDDSTAMKAVCCADQLRL